MAGYLGTKAVLLSTTAATVTGDMTVGGAATISGATTVTGAFTSLGIDDNAAATAMTLDTSGNVGIGVATPVRQLDLWGSDPTTYSTTARADLGTNQRIFNSSNTNSCYGGLSLAANNALGTTSEFTIANVSTTSNYQGELVFQTRTSASTYAERMRIDASGNLLVGTTSSFSGALTSMYKFSGDILAFKTGSSGYVACRFQNSAGSNVGAISVSASSTAYVTSSDYRLKENITPVQGAADIVKAMQPVTYTFKSDGSWHDGFLAHELQELHPRAVTGSKDAMKDEEYEVTPAVLDDDGAVVTEAVMGTRSVPDYQGVDYSKLTPILTAALQEALNKIDALESQNAAFEARLTALEAV